MGPILPGDTVACPPSHWAAWAASFGSARVKGTSIVSGDVSPRLAASFVHIRRTAFPSSTAAESRCDESTSGTPNRQSWTPLTTHRRHVVRPTPVTVRVFSTDSGPQAARIAKLAASTTASTATRCHGNVGVARLVMLPYARRPGAPGCATSRIQPRATRALLPTLAGERPKGLTGYVRTPLSDRIFSLGAE